MYSPYGSSNNTVSWHPEPSQRGTFSLLSTCLITIGLCVWTALHLNIPEPGGSKKQFWRKAKWLLLGLFAPELVAWTAFQQHIEARGIVASMRRAFRHERSSGFLTRFGHLFGRCFVRAKAPEALDPESNATPKRHRWTMVHGHYAAMGGFALDISDAPVNFFLTGGPRATITCDGLNFLALTHPDLIPNIPEEDIRDKSKANGLAKFLVCTQAAWFCATCINRLTQNLPISLLELNTFAHAICTLLIYFLWWDKPLDVDQPSLVTGTRLHSTAAWMSVMTGLVSTKIPLEGKVGKFPRHSISVILKVDFHWGFTPSEPIAEVSPRTHPSPTFPDYIRISDRQSSVCGFTPNCLNNGSRYAHFREIAKQLSCGWVRNGTVGYRTFFDISLSQLKCLELAQEEFRFLEASGAYSFHNYHRMLLCPRISNWVEISPIGILRLEGIKDLQFILGVSIAGLIYGGLHLTAWNAPFETALEGLMWKYSSITLATSGPTMIAFAVSYYSILYVRRFQTGMIETHLFWWSVLHKFLLFLAYSGLFLYTLYFLFYIQARLYLVIESLLNVAHLPPDIYKVPQWSQYFPHIG